MIKHQISPEYSVLVGRLLKQKAVDRELLTIAIDGVDGAGKSSLARFLAWQMDIPVIEMDFYLLDALPEPKYDVSKLRDILEDRCSINQPTIVEGIFILQHLKEIHLMPDILIRVERVGHNGSPRWQERYAQYFSLYPRASRPDHILKWTQKNYA